jgi:hypothetical protein
VIEETIDLVLSRLPPSSGENLTGFLMDCDHFFSQPEEVLRDADAKATGDPRSMVAVTVTLADPLTSLQQVNEALRAAWAEVAYRDYQALATMWYRDAMVLRFVTANPQSRLLVTGTVVASGGGYGHVAAGFERDFAAIRGPLPSWRG